MPITITKQPKSEVLITVEIGADVAGKFFDNAFRIIAADLEVKGFRRGKVPLEIAQGRISSKDILEKGAELAVRETYPDIVTKQKLETVGSPRVHVTKVARGSPFVYEARVAVLPKILLPDYTNLKIEPREVTVGENEVGEALNWLRKSRAKQRAVPREAQKGDYTVIDFTSRLEGAPVEGGASRNHGFILGEGRFVEGFEDQIEGKKAGDAVSFSLPFPGDFPHTFLAGKTVDFEVTVKSVEEREVPPENDEFARGLGTFPDLAFLRESIRKGLMAEKEAREKERFRAELLEKLCETIDVEIPDILREHELDKMAAELRSSVEAGGLRFENYLKDVLKKDISDLRKDWEKQAEKRIRAALVLKEIAKKEEISVSEEEVEEKIKNDMPHGHPAAEKAKKETNLDSMKEYVRRVLQNEKTLDWLEKKSQRGKIEA